MTTNPINPIPDQHREVARKGGSSRSDRKKVSSKSNLAKAREMKLLYRLDPSRRPNGNQR